MRVILDTNILVAALISPTGPPAVILQAFLDERFTLVTCEPQFEEFKRVTRDPELRRRVKPAEAGTLVNELRVLALIPKGLPKVGGKRRAISGRWRQAMTVPRRPKIRQTVSGESSRMAMPDTTPAFAVGFDGRSPARSALGGLSRAVR